MLEAMALGMMRQMSTNIQHAQFFTIMADETADVSNKERSFSALFALNNGRL